MIDEYPMLAALAAFAEGTTVMRGVGELRVKESDRIAAMAAGWRPAASTSRRARCLIVARQRPRRRAGGATIATRLDHRIAMAYLCLGLAAARAGDDGRAAHDRHQLPEFRRR